MKVEFFKLLISDRSFPGRLSSSHERALSGLRGTSLVEKMDDLINPLFLAPFTFGSTSSLDAERTAFARNPGIAEAIQECIQLTTKMIDGCIDCPGGMYMLRANAKVRSARASLDAQLLDSVSEDYEAVIASPSSTAGEKDHSLSALNFVKLLKKCGSLI